MHNKRAFYSTIMKLSAELEFLMEEVVSFLTDLSSLSEVSVPPVVLLSHSLCELMDNHEESSAPSEKNGRGVERAGTTRVIDFQRVP